MGMATPAHDPGTDPRAQGGPVSLGSIWQQWARCRADLYAAGALAGEAERDPDAPPWARRLARSQRQSLYALLSLGSLISVAVRHAASSRPGLWARLRRAWVAFSQVR